MTVTLVIGAQWGDEGKGKIVDVLSKDADVCVRFNGGNNAGHTIINEYGELALHLIPCGIFREQTLSIIANGCVVDPEALWNLEVRKDGTLGTGELQELLRRGISESHLRDNLRISSGAHIIMPWHRLLDRVEEERRGAKKIGTTSRGIGPCYADKYARKGIRAGELLDLKTLKPRFMELYREKEAVLRDVFDCLALGFPEQIWDWLRAYGAILAPHICDTVPILREARAQGKRILLEGAQGMFLDIDHGTYPYVTSSLCGFPGALQGTGLPRDSIDEVIGVVKAYTTRVAAGAFPTEMDKNMADFVRDIGRKDGKGGEYGSTTGRPRRIGWLDLVLLRETAEFNKVTSWALTRLDILTGIDPIKVCYDYEDKDGVSVLVSQIDKAFPVYVEVPGWYGDIANCRTFNELPENAKQYLRIIEQMTGIPVKFISTGPKREQIINRI